MKEWSVNILIQASTLLEIWQDYREETEKEERGSFSFLYFSYYYLITVFWLHTTVVKICLSHVIYKIEIVIDIHLF